MCTYSSHVYVFVFVCFGWGVVGSFSFLLQNSWCAVLCTCIFIYSVPPPSTPHPLPSNVTLHSPSTLYLPLLTITHLLHPYPQTSTFTPYPPPSTFLSSPSTLHLPLLTITHLLHPYLQTSTFTPYPPPSTFHSSPSTLHPPPSTLNPSPSTLHLSFLTLPPPSPSTYHHPHLLLGGQFEVSLQGGAVNAVVIHYQSQHQQMKKNLVLHLVSELSPDLLSLTLF